MVKYVVVTTLLISLKQHHASVIIVYNKFNNYSDLILQQKKAKTLEHNSIYKRTKDFYKYINGYYNTLLSVV